MKIVGIIQARISSNRLPGKVMLDICGKTLLERVIDQAKKSELLQEIYVATSMNQDDELVEIVAKNASVYCYRGSLNDVFQRFLETIELSKADIVVRITADNPLTNYELIDYGIKHLMNNKLDYVGYENVPIGTAVEIFTATSFKSISQNKLNEYDREHVTPYYYKEETNFKIDFIRDYYKRDLSYISLTIDTYDEYVNIYKLFSLNKQISLDVIIDRFHKS